MRLDAKYRHIQQGWATTQVYPARISPHPKGV